MKWHTKNIFFCFVVFRFSIFITTLTNKLDKTNIKGSYSNFIHNVKLLTIINNKPWHIQLGYKDIEGHI